MLLIQQAIMFLYSYWYNKPYATTQAPRYDVILWIPKYRMIIHEQGDRSPAAGGPPPMRTPGAARRTPRQLSKTINFVLVYCVFSVLPFVLLISASPKTHKPRGRASDVSTISTCFSLCYNILPTPPPISVRKAGGITVVYLCGF